MLARVGASKGFYVVVPARVSAQRCIVFLTLEIVASASRLRQGHIPALCVHRGPYCYDDFVVFVHARSVELLGEFRPL